MMDDAWSDGCWGSSAMCPVVQPLAMQRLGEERGNRREEVLPQEYEGVKAF